MGIWGSKKVWSVRRHLQQRLEIPPRSGDHCMRVTTEITQILSRSLDQWAPSLLVTRVQGGDLLPRGVIFQPQQLKYGSCIILPNLRSMQIQVTLSRYCDRMLSECVGLH
jgi:hypothetical protein